MSVQTEHYPLKSELDLTVRDTQSPLTVSAVSLDLTKQDDEIIECRLSFEVNPELYDRIDKEALFNLKPDVRNSLSAGEFLPEQDIKIETSLKPDLLPHLVKHAANNDEAATYIQNLSEEQPDRTILSTDSWLALSVTQQQESGEIGYRTLWSYISPANLAQAATSSEEISQGIINFFKDWTETNLSSPVKVKLIKAESHTKSGLRRQRKRKVGLIIAEVTN